MSDEDMIRARRGPDGRLVQVLPDGTTRPFEDTSDWARVDAMTDEEAYQNALNDPDNPPLTADQLSRMRCVPNPNKIRLSLRMTQEEFARKFQISFGTLRDWEQGVRRPDSTARAYLYVIEKNPQAVQAVIEALNAEAFQRTAS